MEFKGTNILEFSTLFANNEDCKQYLAERKWGAGFTCPKCNHEKCYPSEDGLTMSCAKCKHIDSSTAGTLFHKVKFGLRKAFFIAFEMTTTSKGLSSMQVSKRYGITQKTAWIFMQKVRAAMESSKSYPMEGIVHVDEFVVGQKEENKPGRTYDSKKTKAQLAVELTDESKIKRAYITVIDNYSSKSLRKIFEDHIAKSSNVTTDKWKGYSPLKKDWDIEQQKSDGARNFKELHTIVQQVKSWLRAIPSHVSKKHAQKYFDEFCFRLNRSIYKETIFNKLIERMLEHRVITFADIKCT